jgi:DNA-damage-inducible protein J
MSKTALIQVRVESELKEEMEKLFDDLGLDIPTAIRMFFKQVERKRGLPFEVSQFNPNTDTIAAMEEANSIAYDADVKGYTDVGLMFKEILADV